MTETWRRNFIREQRDSYRAATIEKIDTHWLIFDTQTDEAYPFSEETFSEMDIQIQSNSHEWISAYYYDDNYLRVDARLIPLNDQMTIRIENPLSLAYRTWLEHLSHHTLIQFTRLINDLDYSLFDCIYCHHTYLFQDKENTNGVNFIFLDNGYIPCSIHHMTKSFPDKQENRFDFVLANGKTLYLVV